MSSSDTVTAATATIETSLDALVAIDLDTLSSTALTGLVRSIATAQARLAGLSARATTAAERAGTVDASGAPSATSWLADATGATTHSASRTVSLGRAIDTAPAIADGLADGTLATDKAAALARALDRGVLDAADIDGLVGDAHDLPAGMFARQVRAREAAADNDRLRRDELWARRRRSLTHRRRDDGSLEGRFLLDPIAGDTVLTALRAHATRDPADTPPGDRRTRAQRHADSLVAITSHSLDTGASGEQLTVRPHISVIVPAAALHPSGDRAAAAGAVGTTDHDTMASVQSVRTLLCDAAVRRIVIDPAGRPLDVGRATRSWSGPQRAAAAAIDGGCRGPTCDRPFAWTQLHHIDWWSRGGHTDLDRGIPLCHHCHHLVHDDDWTVDLDPITRTATWTSPDGRTTATLPRGPAAPTRLGTSAPTRTPRAGPAPPNAAPAARPASDTRTTTTARPAGRPSPTGPPSTERRRPVRGTPSTTSGAGARNRPQVPEGPPRRMGPTGRPPDTADEPRLFAPP